MAARDLDPPRVDGFMSRTSPVEIILRILQCCHSTRDLLALVSTCQHICHVWRGNAAAVLWPVWLRSIPHFQDAITAARMTQLVVDAEHRGELPPTCISPDQLQQRRPTPSELRAAFGLHRLSLDIATCFRLQDMWYPKDRRGAWRGPPEDPARMPEWTARVSHTVFRLLIVGAALAGAYKEPLFKALEHPDPEIQALPRRVMPDYDFSPDTAVNDLTQKEIAFFLQFTVCDLDATIEAQDAVFEPIAKWLLQSILSDKEARQAMADRFKQRRGRAGFCLSREDREEDDGLCPVGQILADGYSAYSHSDAHLVVWELMKMFWMVEQVRPYWEDGVLDRRAPRPPSAEGAGADKNTRGPLKSVIAVYFGKFGAEETLLLPTDGPPKNMITFPAAPEKKENDHVNGKLNMSVAVFLDDIFNYSGRPNHIEETERLVPPLELRFFEFFLQRHLGLSFHHQVFMEFDRMDRMEGSYRDFVGTATIFSHDDVENREPWTGSSDMLGDGDFLDGSEMLTKYPPDFTRVYMERWSRL